MGILDETMRVKNIGWSRKDFTDDTLWTFEHPKGRITVLDRMTGYGNGQRDIETGFRSNGWADEEADRGKFWLASGGFDIREFPEDLISEAIQRIKDNANTCIGQ